MGTQQSHCSRFHTILAALAPAPGPTDSKQIAIGECDHLYQLRVSRSLLGTDLSGEIGPGNALLSRLQRQLKSKKNKNRKQ